MKLVIAILFSISFAYAGELIKSAAQPQQITEQSVVANDGIDFKEWESEFDSSIQKAQVKVQKCESSSKNCQFEKYQALDPEFDMVH